MLLHFLTVILWNKENLSSAFWNVSESESEVAQSCPTLCDSVDCNLLGFSRQEYWSGLPFPSPGDLSNPGIEPRSPALQADALTSELPVAKILPEHKPSFFQCFIFGKETEI